MVKVKKMPLRKIRNYNVNVTNVMHISITSLLKICPLHCKQVKSPLITITSQVSELVQGYNHLDGCGRALGCLMLALPALSLVDLSRCRLKASDVETMAEVLKGHKLKVNLFFFSN